MRGRRAAPVLAGLRVWGIGSGWCVPFSVVSSLQSKGLCFPPPLTALPAFPSTTWGVVMSRQGRPREGAHSGAGATLQGCWT